MRKEHLIAGKQENVHEDIAKRLARIAGHAAGLKCLWDEGRKGREMLSQMVAVRAALDAVGRTDLKQEIDHELSRALAYRAPDEARRALKEAHDRLLSWLERRTRMEADSLHPPRRRDLHHNAGRAH